MLLKPSVKKNTREDFRKSVIMTHGRNASFGVSVGDSEIKWSNPPKIAPQQLVFDPVYYNSCEYATLSVICDDPIAIAISGDNDLMPLGCPMMTKNPPTVEQMRDNLRSTLACGGFIIIRTSKTSREALEVVIANGAILREEYLDESFSVSRGYDLASMLANRRFRTVPEVLSGSYYADIYFAREPTVDEEVNLRYIGNFLKERFLNGYPLGPTRVTKCVHASIWHSRLRSLVLGFFPEAEICINGEEPTECRVCVTKFLE